MNDRPEATPPTVDLIGVPMDLGGNRRGTDMGPSAFRIAGLTGKLAGIGYRVEDHGDLRVAHRERAGGGDTNARYAEAIAASCEELRAVVKDSMDQGHTPLVLGGDHSIAIGTVTGIAQWCQDREEPLGVIWVDAHADMNTPDTSPSGNVHGMPLGALLGMGPDRLAGLGGFSPKLRPEHVALIGIRDLDASERRLVADSGVTVFTMKEVDQLGINEVARRAIRVTTQGTAGLHLSLDLDGLDPRIAPGVGTPVRGGLSYRESHLLMEMIADSGRLLAMEVVEQNPILDTRNETAELGVGLILSALGRRIL